MNTCIFHTQHNETAVCLDYQTTGISHRSTWQTLSCKKYKCLTPLQTQNLKNEKKKLIYIYIIKEGLFFCLCVCMYPSSAQLSHWTIWHET